MAEKVKVIELNTQPAQTSIKDLRNQLKAFKDEMANLEEGSDEFLAVANKAGEVKHQLDEINEVTRGASADFGDMLSNATQVTNGLLGGFTAAQGALNLFGVESEAVVESMQKMQALMGIGQGIAQLDDGAKAFAKLSTAIKTGSKSLGGFKTALISTGLGALVVVLGSIIANWDEFTQAIGLSEEAMNKLGNVVGGVMNVLKGSLRSVTQAITKAITGDFSGAWETLKSGFNLKQLYNEGVEQTITKRQKEEEEARVQAAQEAADKRAKIKAEELAKANAQYDAQISKIKATIKDEDELNKQLLAIEQQRLTLYSEGTKEYNDQLQVVNQMLDEQAKKEAERAKVAASAAKSLKEAQTDYLEVIGDITPQEAAETRIRLMEEELKTIEENTAEWYRLAAAIERARQTLAQTDGGTDLEGLFQDTAAIIESYKTDEQLFAESQANKLQILKDALDAQLISIEDYNNTIRQIDDETAEHTKQTQTDATTAIMDISTQAASGISDILGTVADAQDTSTKEGFENNKKLKIAQATIDMISGVVSAISSAMQLGPIVGPIVGAINSAAVLTAGAINIAKIKSTQFESASGASSVSSSAVSSAITQPAVYNQAVQGAEIESSISDTRVFVLESDITTTQKKASVAESENTF